MKGLEKSSLVLIPSYPISSTQRTSAGISDSIQHCCLPCQETLLYGERVTDMYHQPI